MRLARLPLLLAALLAPAVTASIARAQANDQKGPTAQTPSRAGQVAADDIIDRMSRAERAVLVGSFRGRIDFGSGPLVSTDGTSDYDGFVARFAP